MAYINKCPVVFIDSVSLARKEPFQSKYQIQKKGLFVIPDWVENPSNEELYLSTKKLIVKEKFLPGFITNHFEMNGMRRYVCNERQYGQPKKPFCIACLTGDCKTINPDPTYFHLWNNVAITSSAMAKALRKRQQAQPKQPGKLVGFMPPLVLSLAPESKTKQLAWIPIIPTKKPSVKLELHQKIIWSGQVPMDFSFLATPDFHFAQIVIWCTYLFIIRSQKFD